MKDFLSVKVIDMALGIKSLDCFNNDIYYTTYVSINRLVNDKVITLIGNSYIGESPDGKITPSSLVGPNSISIDQLNGDIYFIDNGFNIRKLSGGNLTTYIHYNEMFQGDPKHTSIFFERQVPSLDNSGLFIVGEHHIAFYNFSTSSIKNYAGFGYLPYVPSTSPPGSDHIGGSFVDARFAYIRSIAPSPIGVYVGEFE